MKLFSYIFSLITCTFLVVNGSTPLITKNHELPWSTVIDAINKVSIASKELSTHLTKKFIDQKPILITEVSNLDSATFTTSVVSSDPKTNGERQELSFALECKIVNNQLLIQLKNTQFEALGLQCSAVASKDVNTELVKVSLHLEAVEPKIKPFIKAFLNT